MCVCVAPEADSEDGDVTIYVLLSAASRRRPCAKRSSFNLCASLTKAASHLEGEGEGVGVGEGEGEGEGEG